MPTNVEQIQEFADQQYKWGFVTQIEADTVPKGLNEDIIRVISARKNEPEFMLKWRLSAFERWKKMTQPLWPKVTYPPIDYQEIIYYSAPKAKAGPKTLDEVDPELLKMYEKLGVPLQERAARPA